MLQSSLFKNCFRFIKVNLKNVNWQKQSLVICMNVGCYFYKLRTNEINFWAFLCKQKKTYSTRERKTHKISRLFTHLQTTQLPNEKKKLFSTNLLSMKSSWNERLVAHKQVILTRTCRTGQNRNTSMCHMGNGTKKERESDVSAMIIHMKNSIACWAFPTSFLNWYDPYFFIHPSTTSHRIHCVTANVKCLEDLWW